jgi:protein-tyrosine-phosphatase
MSFDAAILLRCSDTGDVYQDARGALLPGIESAKERALEMVRNLVANCDLVCTVRDSDLSQILQTELNSERRMLFRNLKRMERI